MIIRHKNMFISFRFTGVLVKLGLATQRDRSLVYMRLGEDKYVEAIEI